LEQHQVGANSEHALRALEESFSTIWGVPLEGEPVDGVCHERPRWEQCSWQAADGQRRRGTVEMDEIGSQRPQRRDEPRQRASREQRPRRARKSQIHRLEGRQPRGRHARFESERRPDVVTMVAQCLQLGKQQQLSGVLDCGNVQHEPPRKRHATNIPTRVSARPKASTNSDATPPTHGYSAASHDVQGFDRQLGGRIVPTGPGVFTLSLDLELAWGSWSRGSFSMDTFAGGSWMARRVDDRCRELRLPATWAVVGAMFDLANAELAEVDPESSVSVLRPHLGPYVDPLPTVGHVLAAPHAFLDPELVHELSASSAGHELGTHTYFHATPTTATGLVADVIACRAATPSPVRTLVYPRDAVKHVSALPAAQINQYRAPGAAHYFQKTGKPAGMGRVAHTIDQFLGRPAPLVDVRPGAVVAVPGSGVLTLRYGLRRRIPIRSVRRRFLRPLEHAARTGGVYHLTTHPWNLALPRSDAFDVLGEVLGRAAELRDVGDIEVLTIDGLVARSRQGATTW
jgi:hypothetical protein